MKYFLVDGTVIADHMDADAQANNGLLWMAICLGMATDGLEKPLMDRGPRRRLWLQPVGHICRRLYV